MPPKNYRIPMIDKVDVPKKSKTAAYLLRCEKDHNGIISTMWEVINVGWEIYVGLPISPLMIAAALQKEAETQDTCVKDGRSHPTWPVDLRLMAIQICTLEAERISKIKMAQPPKAQKKVGS